MLVEFFAERGCDLVGTEIALPLLKTASDVDFWNQSELRSR
jgi:hypothetical protein